MSSVHAFGRMGVSPAAQQQRTDEVGKYEPGAKVEDDDMVKTQSLIIVNDVNEGE